MTDGEETLRRHWRRARDEVENCGKSPSALHYTSGALRALVDLARDFGIEPMRCELCGYDGNALITFNNVAACSNAGDCQNRLIQKYREQLKNGAR